jgi:hypothetical protein
MTSESIQITERIGRLPDEVYDYAVDPANLPEWAPGLGSAVENVDGRWFVETPMGRVGFAFVERNAYGVLDHEVTLPSGEVIYNPMRVVRDGERGSTQASSLAAGVGFEPTDRLATVSSFQDCPVRPLRHPAVRDRVTQACATTWRVTQLRFFTVEGAQTLSQYRHAS